MAAASRWPTPCAADPDTEKVPIVFVASRFRGAKHRTEARRRYAPAEYLTTPLDLDTLLARVLEAVPPRAARPPPPSPTIPPPPSWPTPPSAGNAGKWRPRRASWRASAAELRGSLAREPFARLLQRIYAEQRTGALLLSRGETKKIVYFSGGYPVSVRSNVLGECLGQILVARRMINQEVLEESLRRMREQKRHQGEILVEMGALSPHNLERALVGQMEAKLYEVFSWRTGTFRFTEDRAAAGSAGQPGAPARRPDPGGHPPPLRARAPEPGAGRLRRACSWPPARTPGSGCRT